MLEAETASKIRLTTNAMRDWKAERKATRMRRAGASLQEILYKLSAFLESFSGIAELVKAADQQYGGLAYGTVSLLVSVTVHKQQREEAIEEAIEELTYQFPRLETLRRLEPKESLRRLIAEVFELVIRFCRESIDYFASRHGRLGQAVSPKALKMKTLSQLRTKLLEIRKDSEIIMLEQLAEMRKKLQDIEKTGIDTNKRVREAEVHASSARLADLRTLLGLKMSLSGMFPETDIRHCQSVLINEFSQQRRRARRPRQMSWELLNQDGKLSSWMERETSSMLLLGGNNWLDDSQIQLNWLSHASVLLAGSLQSRRRDAVKSTTSPPNVVLFFSCQWDYTISQRLRSTFSDIIRHFIYQLAEQHPDLLRSSREAILKAMETQEWKDKLPGIAFDAMTQLLVNLMAEFAEGTEFTIIIDRLDRCRWGDDLVIAGDELETAMRSLLDVVRNRVLAQGRFRVKILLAMDDGPARYVAKGFAVLRNPALEWRLGWDQERDDD